MLNALGIINGKDQSLDGLSAVPDVGHSMRAWFQKLSLVRVIKQVVDYEIKESEQPFTTSGLIQPFSTRQLAMLPEGQRSWDWQMLNCESGLELKTDEVVKYRNTKYRITGTKNYSAYGYAYYEMVNDYTRDT